LKGLNAKSITPIPAVVILKLALGGVVMLAILVAGIVFSRIKKVFVCVWIVFDRVLCTKFIVLDIGYGMKIIIN
jgi:hypothetical protein